MRNEKNALLAYESIAAFDEVERKDKIVSMRKRIIKNGITELEIQASEICHSLLNSTGNSKIIR